MSDDREQQGAEDEEIEDFKQVDKRRFTEDGEMKETEDEEEEGEDELEEEFEVEPEATGETDRGTQQQVYTAGAGGEQQEAAAAEGEEERPEMVDWHELGVYGVLRFSAGLLMQLAWISLGIQAPPDGGEVEENLPEAKAAIDALEDLIEHLEADLSDEEKRELDSTLANLRMNYVQRAEE